MSRVPGSAVVSLLLVLFASGCAAKRPVLYPNEHLQQVGNEQAEADLEACRQLAQDSGAGPGAGKAGKVAGRTVGGAAVGGATGAVGGAIWGHPGTAAGAGAAMGAVGGFLTSIFSSGEPEGVHKAFVERCLADKGYAIVGWR